MSLFNTLNNKIIENLETVGLIGLGFVGLPLAVLIAKKNIQVIGIDIDIRKIDSLLSGKSYLTDISPNQIGEIVENKSFIPTNDFSLLENCDIIIICVPTPLNNLRSPDLEPIHIACENTARYMKRGILISIESTCYPTSTEEYILPLLTRISGFTFGKDFWICFSPERLTPGSSIFKMENIPKIVGALGKNSNILAENFYSKIINKIHTVSSPKIAEMVKILENSYRLVNISFINELALLCGKMGINIWEVIDAANTKPFGFHAFYPGPGIGGHCIPLDPFYLEYVAKEYNFDLKMIRAAGTIDKLMPHRMTVKINYALNLINKPINGSKILFLGITYKEDVADIRESPAVKIMCEVIKKYASVKYYDPYIAEIKISKSITLTSVKLTSEELKISDCVVITTNHKTFDIPFIVEHSQLLVDLRNATDGIEAPGKIFKL
jgi:UDP-N-acetyl-D-glucosamine dehydrogenase